MFISGLFWLSVSRSRTGDVHKYAGLAVSMWHAEAHTFLSPQSHCRCRHRDIQGHFYGLFLILICLGCFTALFLRFTSHVIFLFFFPFLIFHVLNLLTSSFSVIQIDNCHKRSICSTANVNKLLLILYKATCSVWHSILPQGDGTAMLKIYQIFFFV